jgi:hypothetical protein
MLRSGVLAISVLLPAVGLSGGGAGRAPFVMDHKCAAAHDQTVQALERVLANSSRETLVDANELLMTANDLCSEYGDAWYLRSLVEAKLGHTPKAEYAMRQAKANGSEAAGYGANPFVLATPDARSVATTGETRALPVPAAKAEPTDSTPHKWALVIGIQQFSDSGIKPLQFTTKDADAFAAALKDPAIGQFPADNVKELTNAQATVRNIKEQMNWIARHAEPNDTVVIYVATHGSPRSMDSVQGVNYLLTYDTEMFKGGQFNEDAMYATALPMVELANDVATRMKSLRTLVVLDTCYSGGSVSSAAAGVAKKNANPTPEMLERMSQGTGRIVMAASQADEPSLESPALGHGYFTYYLLEAMKANGGKTPLSQLFARVAENVSKKAAATGGKQHPVL